MRRHLRIALSAALLLVLAACATGPRPTPFWEVPQSAFGTLKPGVSTREDVRSRIGVPQTEMHFPRQNEDVWEYRYLEGTTVRMLAYVYFDAKGVYKYSAHLLDPTYTGAMTN